MAERIKRAHVEIAIGHLNKCLDRHVDIWTGDSANIGTFYLVEEDYGYSLYEIVKDTGEDSFHHFGALHEIHFYVHGMISGASIMRNTMEKAYA